MKITRKYLLPLIPLCFFLTVLPVKEGKVSAHPTNLWTARTNHYDQPLRYVFLKCSYSDSDLIFNGTRWHYGFPFWGAYFDTGNNGWYMKIDTFKTGINFIIATMASILILLRCRFSN